ncbi:MAG: hypothetical protein ACQEQC_05895 [Elusimicrobiota bacterium]
MENINWEDIDIKELSGLISEKLKANGINSILVGGACVVVYSDNEHTSYDLDFVTYSNLNEIKPVLEKLGFKQEGSRHFVNEKCKFYIDFNPPPVSVGKEEAIDKFNKINTERGIVELFTPTDCVKDRLAAYYHWNDPESLEQAIMVAKRQKIDINEIKRWSKKENSMEKFTKFIKLLNKK